MNPKPEEKVVATLYLRVTFDTLPDMDSISEIVEKSREYGCPEEATLTVHKTTKIDVSR